MKSNQTNKRRTTNKEWASGRAREGEWWEKKDCENDAYLCPFRHFRAHSICVSGRRRKNYMKIPMKWTAQTWTYDSRRLLIKTKHISHRNEWVCVSYYRPKLNRRRKNGFQHGYVQGIFYHRKCGMMKNRLNWGPSTWVCVCVFEMMERARWRHACEFMCLSKSYFSKQTREIMTIIMNVWAQKISANTIQLLCFRTHLLYERCDYRQR